MCYIILLSTDLTIDLSGYNNDLVRFSPEMPGLAEEELLAHRQKWFVGSRDGCSCGFRHLHVDSVELGFGEPVDWYPEEPEDIKATKEFISIIRKLSTQGAEIDCVDAWDNSNITATLERTIDIPLSQMLDTEFRFFENHRFVFKTERPQESRAIAE